MKKIVSGLLAAGAATAAFAQSDIQTLESAGNLQATQDPGCIDMAGADPTLTPADLQLGMLDCIAAEDWSRAVDLFALLQARGFFDMARVTDQTAHQGIQVLIIEAMDPMSERQMEALQAALDQIGQPGSESYDAFCGRLNASGQPDYHPSYMIQHGIRAFRPSDAPDIEPGFDPSATWDLVRAERMNCPG